MRLSDIKINDGEQEKLEAFIEKKDDIEKMTYEELLDLEYYVYYNSCFIIVVL